MPSHLDLLVAAADEAKLAALPVGKVAGAEVAARARRRRRPSRRGHGWHRRGAVLSYRSERDVLERAGAPRVLRFGEPEKAPRRQLRLAEIALRQRRPTDEDFARLSVGDAREGQGVEDLERHRHEDRGGANKRIYEQTKEYH